MEDLLPELVDEGVALLEQGGEHQRLTCKRLCEEASRRITRITVKHVTEDELIRMCSRSDTPAHFSNLSDACPQLKNSGFGFRGR